MNGHAKLLGAADSSAYTMLDHAVTVYDVAVPSPVLVLGARSLQVFLAIDRLGPHQCTRSIAAMIGAL